ncbi:MAG: DUF1513 domain-containing protein [Pseudomonadota bacterium]
MSVRLRKDRRRFLQSTGALVATGALPTVGWADAGSPAYLSAARRPNGDYVLCGLGPTGAIRFEVPLPDRGHAAAAHPKRPLAVAFARRPGAFALVIDCALGLETARLQAPIGRHFYGHGAFDPTGRYLYTGENAFESGDGVIGVWDAAHAFERIGEFASGGVGPHELLFDVSAPRLVVANGGVQTHPDSGRAKLNLPTMRPNLTYLDASSGTLIRRVEPPAELTLNSVRHLTQRDDGLVGIAMQWQGDPADAPPLLATHDFGDGALRLLTTRREEQIQLRGYGGSVAFSSDGRSLALTSPRGGRLHVYDVENGSLMKAHAITDVCGVAASSEGLIATDGAGGVTSIGKTIAPRQLGSHSLAWDNHLVKL